MPSLDRTLKLLWLAIGAMLMLFLLAGGVMVVSQVIRNAGAGDEAVRVAATAQPRQQRRAIRYTPPFPVRGTQTQIVMVSYGRDHEAYAYASGGYASSGPREAQVNVMFVDADGVRLLLDRPAYIREISYPEVRDTPPADPPRDWISYVISLDDTNGNGELESRDAATLYVSGLDGRNLRPVTRPPLRYERHAALDPARILVYALEPPPGEPVDEDRMRQRAFIYDVRAGRLSPYAAMDSAAERAGRILRR